MIVNSNGKVAILNTMIKGVSDSCIGASEHSRYASQQTSHDRGISTQSFPVLRQSVIKLLSYKASS